MRRRSRRVLVVDDDRHFRHLVRRRLKGRCRLAQAAGGKQALDLIPRFRPDVILLDVNLPDVDGYATCRRIRNMSVKKPITVIIVSAATAPDTASRAYQAGADDYLPKSVILEALPGRIEALFASPPKKETQRTTSPAPLEEHAREESNLQPAD